MATKRVQLAIDTPCQQRWQDMKPESAGRFCDSCQKTVVDFLGLTDQQIADILDQPTGSACGHFRLSQLNRPLQITTPTAFASGRFFSLLTAGLLGYQTVQAETLPILAVPAVIQTDQSAIGTYGLPANNETASADSSRIITGRVIEAVTNAGLELVSVMIKGTSTGVNADSLGRFQLRVPIERKDDVITLVVVSIGYQAQEIQLRPDQSDPLLISLYEDPTLLGEVIVVGGYKKLSFWKRLRNHFRASH